MVLSRHSETLEILVVTMYDTVLDFVLCFQMPTIAQCSSVSLSMGACIGRSTGRAAWFSLGLEP